MLFTIANIYSFIAPKKHFSSPCTTYVPYFTKSPFGITNKKCVIADVRFVVAWKAEEDTTETAVILPGLYLKKR